MTELQNQRGALDVELAQKNMSVQNLRERIQQKYHVNLDDVRSECITITFADEGPAKVQTLTPEEMAASGAATDWDAVAQQVEALQKRLDEIGPVNLVAIEEYEETEQRYQFLTKQHDDLVSAKAQLLEIINRINVQTRQMFVETFEKIRENFRAMFVEVFGGGKADLILVDENDVLESGIDIVARPPGKQLQSISLLSGGEQTMVGGGAAVFDLSGQAQPVLRAGRIGRGAGRGEHQPLRPLVAAVHRALAIHHHHAQQTHHRAWPTCFTA